MRHTTRGRPRRTVDTHSHSDGRAIVRGWNNLERRDVELGVRLHSASKAGGPFERGDLVACVLQSTSSACSDRLCEATLGAGFD